jgi:hypothetical protein
MLQPVETRRTRAKFVPRVPQGSVPSNVTFCNSIRRIDPRSLLERSVDLNQRVSKENAAEAAPLQLQDAVCLLLARWSKNLATLKLGQGTLDRFCSSRLKATTRRETMPMQTVRCVESASDPRQDISSKHSRSRLSITMPTSPNQLPIQMDFPLAI